jgi:hypothetical protein
MGNLLLTFDPGVDGIAYLEPEQLKILLAILAGTSIALLLIHLEEWIKKQ